LQHREKRKGEGKTTTVSYWSKEEKTRSKADSFHDTELSVTAVTTRIFGIVFEAWKINEIIKFRVVLCGMCCC
jgi:hypothetical protein